MTQPPTPPGPGQPDQPPYGSPAYGQQTPGQPTPAQPAYGQPTPAQPAYGQPAQGQPPYGGQPGAQPYPANPNFGAGQPYSPPPSPGRNRRSPLVRILISVGVVVAVLVVGVFAKGLFHKNDGKSVDGSKVGMCLVINGSTSFNVNSDKTDCNNTALTYIVAEKVHSENDCKTSNPRYTTLTDTQSNSVLCLVPNLRKGKCYNIPTVGNLKEVDCTQSSTVVDTVFKVTQRVEHSTDVPDCSDASTQRIEKFAATPSSAGGPLGFCLQIVGDDYTWGNDTSGN